MARSHIAAAREKELAFYRKQLLAKSVVVLSIQGCGLVFAFAGNILLARVYGQQAYGIYALIGSWCAFLVIPGLFGMDDVHLVQLPALKIAGKKETIRHQLIWSLKVNLISCIIVAVLLLGVLRALPSSGLSGYIRYFYFGLPMIFILVGLNNFLSFLRGMNRVVAGEIIDKIARPVFFILFLWAFLAPSKNDPALGAMEAAVAGSFLTLLCLFYLIKKTISEMAAGTPGPHTAIHSLKQNLRYLLLNVSYFLSARLDMLLLGFFSNVALVGHYNAALKFADISSYPVAVINLYLPSLLAQEKDKHGPLARPALLYRISKNSFALCLLLCVLFLITGHQILDWYGNAFTDAFPVLLIFLVSNLLTASMGSADVFFILEGDEKKPLYCRMVSLSVTFLLAMVLIPLHPMTGAALAMLAGNLVYVVLIQSFFFSRYHFFIHPFAAKQKSPPDQ